MAVARLISTPARVIDRSLDQEDQLAQLTRARGPLRRTLLALSARMVEVRGWERLGYARVGDYARERLGLSARALQEFARVDGQLASLPRLELALMSGRLNWSKLRLLARFASAQDEAAWIARARRVSVQTLEKEVRAVDRGAIESGGLEVDEEGGDARPTGWLRLRVPLRVCCLWIRAREHAARVAGKQLSPSEALELVTAETLSALPAELVAETSGACDEEPARPAGRRGRARAAPARELGEELEPEAEEQDEEMPAFLLPLVAALDRADAFELDARLRRVVRLEQRLDAEIGPLLRQVTANSYTWRTQYRTLDAYARDGLGMSPRKARALVRIERAADACPALRAAYRDGALSWVQAQRLASLLVWPTEGAWREAWVAFAQRVSVRRLEEVVDRALLWREAKREAWEDCRDQPERIAAAIDAQRRAESEGGEIGEDWEEDVADERQPCARPTGLEDSGHVTLWATRDVARLFKAVLCTLRRAMERETGRRASDGDAFGAMLDHALGSWRAERRHERRYRVFVRDGWQCTVPGCTSRRNLQAHHIRFRSAGGSDALENQTTLCAFHHLRGVHAGTIRIRGRAPERLEFELGARNGHPPLVRYGSGDALCDSIGRGC